MSLEPIVSILDENVEFALTLQQQVHAAGCRAKHFPTTELFLRETELQRPGCVVATTELPSIDAVPAYELILRHCGQTPLILRCGDDVPAAVRALSLGAKEIVEIGLSADQLAPIVIRAVEYDRRFRKQSHELAEMRLRASQLAAGELAVLRLVLEGKPNKQIGEILDIKRRTVEDRRARIMKKLQVESIPELVKTGDSNRPFLGKNDSQRGLRQRRRPAANLQLSEAPAILGTRPPCVDNNTAPQS